MQVRVRVRVRVMVRARVRVRVRVRVRALLSREGSWRVRVRGEFISTHTHPRACMQGRVVMHAV